MAFIKESVSFFSYQEWIYFKNVTALNQIPQVFRLSQENVNKTPMYFWQIALFCKILLSRWLRLSLKPWGIKLKFLFLHHENILFPNDWSCCFFKLVLAFRKKRKNLHKSLLISYLWRFISTQTRGRTGMEVNPLVFETSASTDSAIWAHTWFLLMYGLFSE